MGFTEIMIAFSSVSQPPPGLVGDRTASSAALWTVQMKRGTSFLPGRKKETLLCNERWIR